MKAFPHTYPVDASSEVTGSVSISSKDLPTLTTAAPAEFDGPGDQWSPEALLVAAAADCFVLSFRAVARKAELEWTQLECHAEGVLDRVDGVTRFTGLTIVAHLVVPEGVDTDAATELLHKSERVCLISNSLKADTRLQAHVVIASPG